jgi:hypothetical protein
LPRIIDLGFVGCYKVRGVFMKSFLNKVTEDQCKDTGMGVVLISLISYRVFKTDYWLICAVAVLIISMSKPSILRPLAFIWFWISNVLGMCVSKIILLCIFILIVTPVGLFRRLMRKDQLKRKMFKKGHESVMDKRNITFVPRDIAKPF